MFAKNNFATLDDCLDHFTPTHKEIFRILSSGKRQSEAADGVTERQRLWTAIWNTGTASQHLTSDKQVLARRSLRSPPTKMPLLDCVVEVESTKTTAHLERLFPTKRRYTKRREICPSLITVGVKGCAVSATRVVSGRKPIILPPLERETCCYSCAPRCASATRRGHNSAAIRRREEAG